MQDRSIRFSSARKATAGLINALVLVAGISSVVHAGPPTVTRSSFRDVYAQSVDYMAYAAVTDNGDGTAAVYAYADLGDGTYVDVWDPAAAVFQLSNDLKPGQSNKGSFSGTAHAIVDATRTDTGSGDSWPVTLELDIVVTDASDLGAWMQQGVNLWKDPGTGQVHAYRQHFNGNQAYGIESGELTIAVDGVVMIESTGGFGAVGSYGVHSIERIN